MRIELSVDLRPTRRTAAAKPIVDAEARAEKLRRYQEDRRLRRIALAQVIEDQIASGDFASLADAARRCGVSRARVSQVVEDKPGNLLYGLQLPLFTRFPVDTAAKQCET